MTAKGRIVTDGPKDEDRTDLQFTVTEGSTIAGFQMEQLWALLSLKPVISSLAYV